MTGKKDSKVNFVTFVTLCYECVCDEAFKNSSLNDRWLQAH